ncbi:MAG TPA: PA14 domain-containing protein [Tepidisphaeraceae bacterium]|jgi:hypothetical protein
METLETRQLLASNGFSGTYFNNLNFTGKTYTRVDSAVAMSWPDHRNPAPGIKGTSFSVRWSTLLTPSKSSTYTFVTRNSDGVRLWVGGKLLIDSWKQSATTSRSATMYLQSGQRYDLRLEYYVNKRTANISLSWGSARTPFGVVPPKNVFAYDTRIAAIGDYGKNNFYENGTASLMQSWAPNAMITVGDNNYPRGEAPTIDANVGRYFHNYIAPYTGSYGAGAKTNAFFPTLGNHDWETQSAKPFFDYFTLPGNERYYDVRIGSVHLFALDSDPAEPDGTSSTSKQAQWLKQKLTASTAPFKIVYFHHAPFSSGEEGNTPYMDWPFNQWGADAVVTGHNHVYERIVRNDTNYIVNGAGGFPGKILQPLIEGSVAQNNSDSGALLILASDTYLTLQYQLRSGQIVDTVTIVA